MDFFKQDCKNFISLLKEQEDLLLKMRLQIIEFLSGVSEKEINAGECRVYGVDNLELNSLFTVDSTGEYVHIPLEKDSLFQQSIVLYQAFIVNEITSDILVGDNDFCSNLKNILIMPIGNDENNVIGIIAAKNKEGGFSEKDITAFNTKFL